MVININPFITVLIVYHSTLYKITAQELMKCMCNSLLINDTHDLMFSVCMTFMTELQTA